MKPRLRRATAPLLPFVGISATALAATLLRTQGTRWNVVGVAAAVVAAATSIGCFWPRSSLIRRGLPLLPFVADVVLVLLRHAQGGSTSGYAPLVILPVLWVGLTGRRRTVAAITAATALVFAAPIVLLGAPLYPATGGRGALLWTVVAGFVGTITQRGISAQRIAAAAAAQRAAGLDRLVESQNAIAAAGTDVDEVLTLVAQGALAVAGAEAACVELLDGDEVVCSAVAGAAAPFLGMRVPFDSSITGECFRTGEALICGDSEADSRVSRDACRAVGARTLIVLPLRSGETVTAVLIAWSSTAHDFPGYEAQLLTALANASAAAILRAQLIVQLTAQAVTDELTGLPNRRSWHQHLDAALARSRRRGTPLSVVLLDLDRFKSINDEHGHAAGDDVLRTLGTVWRLALRQTDVLGRLGGDEFGLILEDTDEVAATQVLHRLHEAAIGTCGATAGVAQWDGAETPDALLARADACMYRGKAVRGDRPALSAGAGADVIFL